jgi:hypothetical protein
MRRWAFLVVRPSLSSSSTNFSKPRSRTVNLDFWNYKIKNCKCLHAWIHASEADKLIIDVRYWNPQFLLWIIHLPQRRTLTSWLPGDWRTLHTGDVFVFWVGGWTSDS